MSSIIFFIVLAAVLFLVFKMIWKKPKWNAPTVVFPQAWVSTLENHVAFYRALNKSKKKQFEFEVHEFLLNVKITPISTNIDDVDRVLISASAVIPIFSFPTWRYTNLKEVLVYPDTFSHDFETEGTGRKILGMVGTGYMEGKMILSKNALHHGFSNDSDRRNTAVHEFVHLIDKIDGNTDGIPHALLEKPYVIPWVNMIEENMQKIQNDASTIRPYGGTNKQEFFAVVSEYFFEKPKLLSKNHPEIYAMLEMMYSRDMDVVDLSVPKRKIGRNDLCHCGSGKKYKNCHLRM